jgi:NifB/MoaA-like Fe-S oxidoreductase
MVIVPGMNDGDVLETSLADLWALGDAVLSVALVPVGLTQFSHLYTGEPMSTAHAGALLETADHWAARAARERDTPWVFGSDELYLLARRELPPPAHYGDFDQVENGVGAVAALRMRVSDGLHTLPRLEGKRIAVVTGLAMSSLMPPLLDQLARQTGADFELIPTVNSLFGKTTTTAGLLVGADVRGALLGRTGFHCALIPAETVNDAGLFLDDDTFEAVAEALPMPVHLSYDFIDVLQHVGTAEPSDTSARAA